MLRIRPVIPVFTLFDVEVSPVDNRDLSVVAVRFEDDHVAGPTELLVAGFSARFGGYNPSTAVGGVVDEPVVVGHEDEIVRVHVRLHAPAFDGDHRGPNPRKREQQ